MSDYMPRPVPPRQTDRWLEPGQLNVQIVYVLYLVGFVIGITAIVGLVIAYINRGKAGGWIDTHYTFQIRTFWIALLGGFVSLVLMLVAVGFVLGFLVAVWVIIRCIVGLQAAGRSEPIKDPQSWWI